MIKQCVNEKTGVVYAYAKTELVDVDEVIAFLEKHRGKQFYNGAAGEVGFRADEKTVSADMLSWFLENDFECDNEKTEDAIYEYLCKDGDYPTFESMQHDTLSPTPNRIENAFK